MLKNTQQRKAASDYARAKVQEIRKKFGYSQPANPYNNSPSPTPTSIPIARNSQQQNKQNTQLGIPQSSSEHNKKKSQIPSSSSSISKLNKQTYGSIISSIKKNVNIVNTNISTGIGIGVSDCDSEKGNNGLGGGGGQLHQFENRIRNIDEINKKIGEILRSKGVENVENKNGFTVGSIQSRNDKVYENGNGSSAQVQIARTRRASLAQYDRNCPNKRTIPTNLNLNLNLDLAKPVSPIQQPLIKKQNQQLSKLSSQKPLTIVGGGDKKVSDVLTKESLGLGLRVPNSKYTVSIELYNSPKGNKQQKNRQVEKQKKQREHYFKRQEKTREVQPSAPSLRLPTPKIRHIQQEQGKKQTQKLAQILSEQILRDQKLRYSKWQFSEWQNPQKFAQLQQKFTPKLSLPQLQKLFTLCPEQHNPFFQSSQPITSQCLPQLLLHYEQASNFWRQQVRECVSIYRLEKQYFSVRDLDLNRKGYLSIEDIVCFVNLYTGKFFRNRDAIGLMKRFMGDGGAMGEGVGYECFLDKITRT